MQQAKGAKIQITQMANAQKASAAAGKAMLANIGIALAISAAVSLAAKGIDYLINKEERITEAAEEAKTAIEEIKSSFKELSDTTDNVKDRYAELAQGVANLGKATQSQGSLSTDEYNEFLDISNQLKELFPQLTKGYDDNGNAILNLSGNVDTIVGSLNTLIETEQKLSNQELIDNMDDVWTQYQQNIGLDGYGGELEALKERKDPYIDILESVLNGDIIQYDPADFTDPTESYVSDIMNVIGKSIEDVMDSDEVGFPTFNFSELSEENIEDLQEYYSEYLFAYQEQVSILEAKLSGEHAKMKDYLYTYLSMDFGYLGLDANKQDIINEIIAYLDFENLPNDVNSWENLTDYVNNNFIQAIKNIDNEDITDQLYSIIFNDLNEPNNLETYENILSYLEEQPGFSEDDPLYLHIKTLYLDEQQANDNVVNHLVSNIDDINTRMHMASIYEDQVEKLSDAEKEAILNLSIPNGVIYSWEEVLELISQTSSSLNDIVNTSTISDSVSQIATQLKPQFDELASAYTAIFKEDGFDLNVVDNAMLEGLRTSFAEIEEEIGVTFNADLLNTFFDTLTDGTSTAEDVQQAFDDLATSYFYCTDTLEHLNDETAESIKQQLEQMGVVNNEEVVNHYLTIANAQEELISLTNDLTLAQQELAEANNHLDYWDAEDRVDSIEAEILALINEKGATEELRIALFNLHLQEMMLNGNPLDTSEGVSELIQFAEAARISGVYIAELIHLQSLFNQHATAMEAGLTGVASALEHEISVAQGRLQQGLNVDTELDLQVDFPDSSSAGSAGSDAGSTYTDKFNEELERLQMLRDNGTITEKEYLDQLRILYERYYKDKAEYLDEYIKYEYEYLKGLKDLYENVLSGITDLLDKQIDELEEKRESEIEALEKERDARTEALEQQKEQLDIQIELIDNQIEGKQKIIDGINAEIDAMQDANDERQRAIDLQKAQFELERAQNQRTILQYSDNKGFHYVSDPDSIRDSREQLEDVEFEIAVSEKEKQIGLIEEEISLLENRRDILQDQQEELDKQIDKLDEYYEKLIENTESYYESLISPIEAYKLQFEDIAEIESTALIIEQLQSLGYSVDDILAHSASTLENFKSNYLGILGDLYSDNTQMLGAIGQVSGLQGGDIAGYLEMSKPYIDSLARLDLSSTQAAIDSANSGIHSFADGAVLATVNITNMADTVTNALYGSKKESGVIQQFGELSGIISESAAYVQNINDGLNKLNGTVAECTIRVNVETKGNAGILGRANLLGSTNLQSAVFGNAHVEGTAKLSGDWGVREAGRSLLGEVGRELIVRRGRFFTVGENGAEFIDLHKGDVVFNHKQTEELLSKGHISSRGRAYAEGTASNLPKGLTPLSMNDDRYKMLTAIGNITGSINTLNNTLVDLNRDIFSNIKATNITHNSSPTITIGDTHITCTGVTPEQVKNEISNSFSGLMLNAYQKAMKK